MACNTNIRTVKMGIDYGSISILCTKNIDRNLLIGLDEKDIHVDIIPFIDTMPLVNNYLIGVIESLASKAILAVFTSVNAVKAVANLLPSAGVKWLIACVDKATHYAVQDCFPNNKIIITANDATALAQKIIEKKDTVGESIVYFNGNKSLDTIPVMCKNEDIDVQSIMVYQTIIKSSIIEKEYQGVLFFSPSAVDSFFVFNIFPQNAIAFCIGATTADALTKKLSAPVIVVQAAEHSPTSLIESLIVYYNR